MVKSAQWSNQHNGQISTTVRSAQWSNQHNGQISTMVRSAQWSNQHNGQISTMAKSARWRSIGAPMLRRRHRCRRCSGGCFGGPAKSVVRRLALAPSTGAGRRARVIRRQTRSSGGTRPSSTVIRRHSSFVDGHPAFVRDERPHSSTNERGGRRPSKAR